jgi:hypothetical protein
VAEDYFLWNIVVVSRFLEEFKMQKSEPLLFGLLISECGFKKAPLRHKERNKAKG